ncbi:MAG: condensation domain-containing protein, partial [Psychrosphaera sp.]|nr:condensation domain-containing protein [Psychrosphaera sp.]
TPLQVVSKQGQLLLQEFDWRALSGEAQEQALVSLMQNERGVDFEFGEAPMMRLHLCRIAPKSFNFVWTMHHAIIDGWSLPIVLQRLMAVYQQLLDTQTYQWPVIPQYRGYIEWLQQQDKPRADVYWQQYLAGFTVANPLPLQNSGAKPVASVIPPQLLECEFPADLTARAVDLARRDELTLSVLMQAFWALVIADFSGDEDIVFGYTVSGRAGSLAGVGEVVGSFINTLPVRLKITPQTPMLQWLKAHHQEQVEQQDFAFTPLVDIQSSSNIARGEPLFDSLVVFENVPASAALPEKAGALQARDFRGSEQTNYPLTLVILEAQSLLFKVSFDSKRFDKSAIEQMMNKFQSLLQRFLAAPQMTLGELDIKLVEKAVQSVEELETVEAVAYVAPVNETQTELVAMWTEVLEKDPIGIHDNFFELGGQSILATVLVFKIQDVFTIDIGAEVLFENPTIALLALQVLSLQDVQSAQPQVPLVPIQRTEKLRLSYSQRRLWFLEQLQGPAATYNIPSAQRLSGPIDMKAWRSSVSALVAMQESLRTTFDSVDGEAVAIIADEIEDIITMVNLADLSPAHREERIAQLVKRDAQQPFDLVAGPLIRMKLLQLAENEHILLLNMHHIISDGWSVGVLIKQLLALYETRLRGDDSQLAPLPVQYVDYAHWQKEWLDNGVGVQQLAYWEKQLQGTLPILALPTDKKRPLVQTYIGDLVTLDFSSELSTKLQTFSSAQGVTLYMVFLSAFQILLSRYSGQSDVAVGSITASRNRQETQDLIGCFVNSIVLRSQLSEDMGYRDFLGEVKKMTFDAYANQDVPFEQLVDKIQPQRALDQSPLFQVALVQNTPNPDITLAGMKVTPVVGGSKTSRF